MGLLDLMLGRTDTGEQGVEGTSYTLPKETHAFVTPVAVRRRELEAVDGLLEAEAEAPALDVSAEEVQDVFDSVFDDHEVDATALTERTRRPRQRTEPLIETWLEQVTEDVGVVYAPEGTYETVRSFVAICRRRDEDDDDPFDLPESFPDAAALLKRLEAAADDQYRAVVHTDLVPEGGP